MVCITINLAFTNITIIFISKSMENITNYCDEIYEILCSLDENTKIENSDSCIWNDWQYDIELSDMPFSRPIYVTEEERTPEEIEEEEYMMDQVTDFIQTDYELGYIGKRCERIRRRCIDNVVGRFLALSTKDRKLYVRDVLKKMSYISQNHPLADRYAFRRVVVPELFQKLIERFQYYDIPLNRILSTFGPFERARICSLLNIAYKEPQNEQMPNQSVRQGLEDLFVPSCRPFVFQFIERLEEAGIIMNRKYNYPKKNYLAKLVTYMREQGIVCGGKKRVVWKHFYEYFGAKVVDRRDEGIESEEEYIITESNLFKSENKNISEEEEKDFDLICCVFPSKL